MSINAINSMSIFGNYQNYVDSEYLRIKAYLESHGYVPTGNKNIDLQTYNQLKMTETRNEMIVKRASQTNESNEIEQSDNYTEQEVPWADFMRDLGLRVTGDYDEDKAKTLDEIEKRIRNAGNESEKAYYESMLNKVNEEFNQPISQNSSIMDFSTASMYLGELNKAMFVNSR